jgi:hypothetical protein
MSSWLYLFIGPLMKTKPLFARIVAISDPLQTSLQTLSVTRRDHTPAESSATPLARLLHVAGPGRRYPSPHQQTQASDTLKRSSFTPDSGPTAVFVGDEISAGLVAEPQAQSRSNAGWQCINCLSTTTSAFALANLPAVIAMKPRRNVILILLNVARVIRA